MGISNRIEYIVTSFEIDGCYDIHDIESWVEYIANQLDEYGNSPQLDHIEDLVDRGEFDEAYEAMGF